MNEQVRESRGWLYFSQLSVNYFGWSFCWAVAVSYMVPNMLLRVVDDSVKNSRLGYMTGAANAFLIILLPIAGAISDRLRWRAGRRKPFYLSAAFTVSTLTLITVFSHNFLLLFILLVLMHAANAGWFINYTLIRDIVPLARRGRIAGMTNITGTLGTLLAHMVAPFFITSGRMIQLALIGAAANTSSGLWVALRIKEPLPAESPPPISSWKGIYLPKLEISQGLGWLAAVNLFTQMGSVAMTCFLLYFIKDQIDSTHFNETFRNVYLIGTGPALISAIGAGFIADRLGRKRVLVAGCLLQIASMINFLIFPWSHSTLYVTGLLFGLGNAAYWSLYWTILSDLVPEQESSKYMGLIQFTSLIPWAIIPPALGAIIDRFGAASGRGYHILFVVILILLTLGMMFIRGIPETLTVRSQPAAAEDF